MVRHIIVEGIDASGKSTLAIALARAFHWTIQLSEGPPHFPGEMNTRLTRYANFHQPHIFDRHPVVSQVIYGTLRTHSEPVSQSFITNFYKAGHVIIYCDPGDRGMASHQFNPTVDTPEHLDQVHANYHTLLNLYRVWAIGRAHLMYRIGDSVLRIINATKGMISHDDD